MIQFVQHSDKCEDYKRYKLQNFVLGILKIHTYLQCALACNGDFNDFIPSNLPRQTRTVVTQRQILRMSNGFTNFIRHVTISQSASNIHILTCIKCFCRTYFIVRAADLFSRFFENRSPLAPISIVIS